MALRSKLLAGAGIVLAYTAATISISQGISFARWRAYEGEALKLTDAQWHVDFHAHLIALLGLGLFGCCGAMTIMRREIVELRARLEKPST